MCLLPGNNRFLQKGSLSSGSKFSVLFPTLSYLWLVVLLLFQLRQQSARGQTMLLRKSHRKPRDISQSVSPKITSILISCSIKSIRLLDLTLKALKPLNDLITSKREAPQALWLAVSTRYSIKERL